MKDFNYHTSHLKNTIGRTLTEEFGEDGKKAVELALEEYADIFGREYMEIL